MNQAEQRIDPAAKGRPILDEADIGSGEKTPAQHETEEMIRQIPPLPAAGKDGAGAEPAGKATPPDTQPTGSDA